MVFSSVKGKPDMPSIASNYIHSDVNKRQKGVPLHFDSTVTSLVMKNTKNKGQAV